MQRHSAFYENLSDFMVVDYFSSFYQCSLFIFIYPTIQAIFHTSFHIIFIVQIRQKLPFIHMHLQFINLKYACNQIKISSCEIIIPNLFIEYLIFNFMLKKARNYSRLQKKIVLDVRTQMDYGEIEKSLEKSMMPFRKKQNRSEHKVDKNEKARVRMIRYLEEISRQKKIGWEKLWLKSLNVQEKISQNQSHQKFSKLNFKLRKKTQAAPSQLAILSNQNQTPQSLKLQTFLQSDRSILAQIKQRFNQSICMDKIIHDSRALYFQKGKKITNETQQKFNLNNQYSLRKIK